MVLIDERSKIDPQENFNFKFEPMVGASSWYPGVTNRPPNGSDCSYIGGGKHYFVYVPVELLPKYFLSLSGVEQVDEKIAFSSGISKCPLAISYIETP